MIRMRPHPFAVFVLLAATVTVLAHDAAAQCSTQWVPSVGAGPNGPVFASHAFDPDGPGPANPQALVGGFFGLGPVGAPTHVALYDPIVNSWSALGTGVDSTVIAVLRLPNGALVAGGGFAHAGGLVAHNVARWNGTAWSAFGAGPGGIVRALAVLPNGNIIAGGEFGVAEWNGTAWLPMGSGPTFVAALATRPNGNVVAGGTFSGAFGVHEWNGTAWSPLGSCNGDVRSLLLLDNGDVVAGGAFSGIGGVNAVFVARFDGTTWSALPGLQHSARALAALPNGDLVAAGGLAPSAQPNLVSRWNGTSWSVLGGGMDSAAWTLASFSNGDLLAGGTFTTIGGTGSANVARLTTTCPATTAVIGTGCTGSAGVVSLAPTNLPWVGSTFRATATGLPALGIAVHVVGFTPLSTPLVNVLPQALPGCVLRASPDFLEVLFPTAGAASTMIVLPNSPALAGLQVHEQVVPLEISASLVITAATSSNALQLTIGVL